jgi:hypothetical protein
MTKKKCTGFINLSLCKYYQDYKNKKISISDLANIIKSRTAKQIKCKINKLLYRKKTNSSLITSSQGSLKDFGKTYLNDEEDMGKKYVTLTDSITRNKVAVEASVLYDIFTMVPCLNGRVKSAKLNEYTVKELVGKKRIDNFMKQVVNRERR